ncbi:hypothetical protein P4G95_23965 [Burkholderia vietnamiensis]|uniref:hypothetical protein n=1 Tax=Burkholderia vietnamiensis TaxID=60552 RepID=UPI0024C04992|nr:hypothetical protein [Burkholderia vietnamiensis]WHU94405.1 hypothetical protein P4G95_23965 [Burkholderia vietnamiensis]
MTHTGSGRGGALCAEYGRKKPMCEKVKDRFAPNRHVYNRIVQPRKKIIVIDWALGVEMALIDVHEIRRTATSGSGLAIRTVLSSAAINSAIGKVLIQSSE